MKFLSQVATAHERITALGAGVVGVAPASPSQAARLQPGVPFPLLLDPDRQVTEALAFKRQSRAAYLLNIRAWLRWLGAFLTHRRQGRFTGHHSSLPGVAIVDSSGEPTWVYRGRELGDYPRLGDVLERLAQ